MNPDMENNPSKIDEERKVEIETCTSEYAKSDKISEVNLITPRVEIAKRNDTVGNSEEDNLNSAVYEVGSTENVENSPTGDVSAEDNTDTKETPDFTTERDVGSTSENGEAEYTADAGNPQVNEVAFSEYNAHPSGIDSISMELNAYLKEQDALSVKEHIDSKDDVTHAEENRNPSKNDDIIASTEENGNVPDDEKEDAASRDDEENTGFSGEDGNLQDQNDDTNEDDANPWDRKEEDAAINNADKETPRDRKEENAATEEDDRNPQDIKDDDAATEEEDGNPRVKNDDVESSEKDGCTTDSEHEDVASRDNEEIPKYESADGVSMEDVGRTLGNDDDVTSKQEGGNPKCEEETRKPKFASMREITDPTQWINDLLGEYKVTYRKGKKRLPTGDTSKANNGDSIRGCTSSEKQDPENISIRPGIGGYEEEANVAYHYIPSPPPSPPFHDRHGKYGIDVEGGFPSLPLRRPDLMRVKLTDIICSSPWRYFEKSRSCRPLSPLVIDSTFILVCRNGLEPEAASQRLKNGRMSKIPVLKRSRPNSHTGNTSPPVSMSDNQCEDENGPQSESSEQARENNDIEIHKEESLPVSVSEADQEIEAGRRSKSPQETIKSNDVDIQRKLNLPASILMGENETETVEKSNVSMKTTDSNDTGSEAGSGNTPESSIGSKEEMVYTFPRRDKHVPCIKDAHSAAERAQGNSLRKRVASVSPIPVLTNKPRIKMENLESSSGSHLSGRSSLTHLSGLPSKPKIPVAAKSKEIDQTKRFSVTDRPLDEPKDLKALPTKQENAHKANLEGKLLKSSEKSKLPVPKVRTSPVQNEDFNKRYEGSGRSLQKRENKIPADDNAGKIIDDGKGIPDGDRDKTRPADSNMAKNDAEKFTPDALKPNSSLKTEESPKTTPRACRKEVPRTAIQHSSYLDMHRRRLISRQEKDERSNIRRLNTKEGKENVATILTKYGNHIPHPPAKSYGYGKASKAPNASRELQPKKTPQQKEDLSQRPPWNAPAAVRSKWEASARQRISTKASAESNTPRIPRQMRKPDWNSYKPLPAISMSGGMKRTPGDRKIVAEAKPNIANVMNKKAVLPAIGSRCDGNANIVREGASVGIASDTVKTRYEVKGQELTSVIASVGSSPSMEVVATGTESDAITPTSGRVSRIPVLVSGPGNGRSRLNSSASTSSTPVNINDNSRIGFSSTSLSSLSSVSLRGFMRVTPEDIDYARLYCAKYADTDFVYFKIMPNLCNGQIVPYLDLWCLDDDFMRAKAMMLKYCRRPSEPSAPAPLGFQMKRTDTQINRWCSSAKGKIILNDQLDCSAVIYRPIGREQIRKTFYGYHSYGGHQFEENLLARSSSSIQGSPVVERINRTPFELLDYLSVSSDKTPSSFCSCSGPVPVLSSSDSSSFCRPDSGSLNSSQRYTGGPVTESVTIDVRASSEIEEPVKNDSIFKRIKRFFFPRV